MPLRRTGLRLGGGLQSFTTKSTTPWAARSTATRSRRCGRDPRTMCRRGVPPVAPSWYQFPAVAAFESAQFLFEPNAQRAPGFRLRARRGGRKCGGPRRHYLRRTLASSNLNPRMLRLSSIHRICSSLNLSFADLTSTKRTSSSRHASKSGHPR